MNEARCEEIINKFGLILESLSKTGLFPLYYPESSLPFPRKEIEQAFEMAKLLNPSSEAVTVGQEYFKLFIEDKKAYEENKKILDITGVVK